MENNKNNNNNNSCNSLVSGRWPQTKISFIPKHPSVVISLHNLSDTLGPFFKQGELSMDGRKSELDFPVPTKFPIRLN